VVENVIIDTEVRSQGLDTFMLAYIERICSELDCSKIMLQSSTKRTDADVFLNPQGIPNPKKWVLLSTVAILKIS
jgi:hypothetical protein